MLINVCICKYVFVSGQLHFHQKINIHMYGYKHHHVGFFLYIHGAFCRAVPKIAPSCVEKLQYQRCILGIQLTCMVAIDFLSLGPCLLGTEELN